MGPGERRPHDDVCWTRPWSTALFVGDLFEAVPFGDQPIGIYEAEDAETGSSKHFVGEVRIGYGLLITPTCDMTEQREGGIAHPYRVLVPVLPLGLVAEQAVSDREEPRSPAEP